MDYNKQTVYNASGVYKEAGGGGVLDENEYFEQIPVYWDNQYSEFSRLNPVASFSNNDLLIKAQFYSPSNCEDIVLRCGQSNSWSDPGIKLKFGNTMWLSNGTNINVSPGLKPSGIIDIEIDGTTFKINGNSYTGGFSSETITNIWPVPGRQGNYAYSPYSKVALIEQLFIDKITNKILCHIVGAKRKNDGMCGVFQLEKGYFYGNSNFKSYPGIL